MIINPLDLRITVFNTGSTWFPKFTGIRVTHIPTSISVTMESKRSAYANRQAALDQLIQELQQHSDYYQQLELF